MTDDADRLKKIRERAEKASEGPWEWWQDDAQGLQLGRNGPVATMLHVMTAYRCESCVEADRLCLWPSEENRAFIAHAREDMPWLLATIDDLREQLKAADLIVDKLPKTADGVRINVFRNSPPPYVWVINETTDQIIEAMVVGWIAGVWEEPANFFLQLNNLDGNQDKELSWPVVDCYSSRRAAFRKAQEDEK